MRKMQTNVHIDQKQMIMRNAEERDGNLQKVFTKRRTASIHERKRDSHKGIEQTSFFEIPILRDRIVETM